MAQIGLRSFTVVAFLSVFMGGAKNFNSVRGYSFLHDYGKADAAIPSRSVRTLDYSDLVHKESQKVALCIFGKCVDIPNIPILNPKAHSQNQPTPTVSPEQPANAEQERPLVSDNEKPITDLTGTWIWRGTTFSIHKGGCTAGYTGELTFNGQNADQGVEITFTQKNNQVLIPGTAVAYSPGLSQGYTESNQGTISGNRFRLISLGNPSFADSTVDHVGTVSNDGNTITGESFCKSPSGPATAKGTFTLTRKQAQFPVQFALTRATTTDAQSVTVDYTIGATESSGSSQPIHFEIYRSPTEDTTPSNHKIWEEDIKIGENDIPNQTNSTPEKNKHQVKLNLQDKDALKPNTAFPYVVVVATYNGKKSTTYFRKWMLGAISHGFNRWNQRHWQTAAEMLENPPPTDRYTPVLANLTGIPDWETAMAKNLKKYDNYDDVISFDWTKTCGLDQPDMAVQAGVKLREEILDWISFHRKNHSGDVVDIHLIGHSRGTVVVTQALNGIMPILSEEHLGSYIELTLLDPHPANNESHDSRSDKEVDFARDKYGNMTNSAVIAESFLEKFQSLAIDPAPEIPKGVNKIDLWYQKTKANDLTNDPYQQDIMNLWGLDDTGIINHSDIKIHPNSLTIADKPPVSHNQVPAEYEKQVVETGKLNRSE
ncbi:MAG: hypothetical protein V7K14_26240 [Nostoc sp.]|uniref:hypothetical protein n=1 Tax=Nostoc sp. TaxID=1180 RepID=UPI002FF9D1C1